MNSRQPEPLIFTVGSGTYRTRRCNWLEFDEVANNLADEVRDEGSERSCQPAKAVNFDPVRTLCNYG